MRKHVMMWWLAGGATLLGASLTYLATRPAVAPVVARAQAGAARLRESRVWEHGVWAAKELGDRLGDRISDLLRKDSTRRGRQPILQRPGPPHKGARPCFHPEHWSARRQNQKSRRRN